MHEPLAMHTPKPTCCGIRRWGSRPWLRTTWGIGRRTLEKGRVGVGGVGLALVGLHFTRVKRNWARKGPVQPTLCLHSDLYCTAQGCYQACEQIALEEGQLVRLPKANDATSRKFASTAAHARLSAMLLLRHNVIYIFLLVWPDRPGAPDE